MRLGYSTGLAGGELAMPKVGLKQGRQAQEIGAAIIGAWLRMLPESATILSMDARNPLTITIDRAAFATGGKIRIRHKSGSPVIDDITVRSATAGAQNSQKLIIEDSTGQDVNYTGGDLKDGEAIPEAPTYPDADLKRDLKIILQDIVQAGVSVEVHLDGPNLINVAVPRLPDGVLSRSDLIEYLRDYHQYGQGRHYHDELATAVLFGCR
jgi:hypothetical protein